MVEAGATLTVGASTAGGAGDALELPPPHPVRTVSDKPVSAMAKRVTSAALEKGKSTRQVVMRIEYVRRSPGTRRKQGEWPETYLSVHVGRSSEAARIRSANSVKA